MSKARMILVIFAILLPILGICAWLYYEMYLVGSLYPAYLDAKGARCIIVGSACPTVGPFHNDLAPFSPKVDGHQEKRYCGYINRNDNVHPAIQQIFI